MDQITDIDSKNIANTKGVHKDSLISLKMGKENPLTGKTDTVGNVNSGKLSFGGNLFGNKSGKGSKFSQENWDLVSVDSINYFIAIF